MSSGIVLSSEHMHGVPLEASMPQSLSAVLKAVVIHLAAGNAPHEIAVRCFPCSFKQEALLSDLEINS